MASASAFAPTKPNTFIGLLSQRGSSYLEQNHPLDLEYSVTPCSSFFNPNQIAWGPGIIPKCQLASFQEMFPHCSTTEQEEENSSQISQKQSQVAHTFPILELIMKQPVKMEDLSQLRVNSLRQRRAKSRNFVKRKGSVITMSTSTGQARQDYGIQGKINSQPQSPLLQYKDDVTLTYKISYRLSHKFTLKFQTVTIEVDPFVTAAQFTQKLLKKIYRSASGVIYKEIFIQKERDLVPLIEMSQLCLSQPNLVQIRDLVRERVVIEKPLLLKKKNTPDIGITELLAEEQSKRNQTKKSKN